MIYILILSEVFTQWKVGKHAFPVLVPCLNLSLIFPDQKYLRSA